MRSKDADRITNRVDPDQTAPCGAVWSGSALFVQTYLSQYFKSLWYIYIPFIQNLDQKSYASTCSFSANCGTAQTPNQTVESHGLFSGHFGRSMLLLELPGTLHSNGLL